MSAGSVYRKVNLELVYGLIAKKDEFFVPFLFKM
jgi:hypothetical protein